MMPVPEMTSPPGRQGGRTGGRAASRGDTVITMPMSPAAAHAWIRMRHRVDRVRGGTGRVATLAGAAAATAVLADPALWWVAGGAAAAVTAAGVGVLRLQMPHAGHQKATATTLYVVPGVALGALLVAERVFAAASGGGVLLQLAAVAAWTSMTWLLRPARVARRMACPPPPPLPDTTVVAAPPAPPDAHPAARWWHEHVAAPSPEHSPDGAVAPGTVLEGIERTGAQAMTAIIRAVTPGEPVPDISIRRLSALLDVPEDQITIGPVPGRGSGVRRLSIGTPDAAPSASDPATVWAETIAPLAVPGAVLTGFRIGRLGTSTPAEAATAPAAPPGETS